MNGYSFAVILCSLASIAFLFGDVDWRAKSKKPKPRTRYISVRVRIQLRQACPVGYPTGFL